MIIKKFRISAEVLKGPHSHQENFERTKDLFARFAEIHPLLKDFSWIGIGQSGWKSTLVEPLLRDATLDQWTAIFLHDFHDIDAVVGRSMVFWNRQAQKADRFMIRGLYNAALDNERNNFFVTRLPVPDVLIQPEIIDAITLAFIASFDAYRIEHMICELGADSDHFWQLWLKDGIPYPVAGEDFRLSIDHPSPAYEEPWHGGTRYVWPQHEPRAFLGLDD